MEVFFAIIGVFAVSLFFIARLSKDQRKAEGAKARKAMGAGLFAINEIFHPAAHESSIVLEVQREERAPLPSPEDKPNPAK
jgi:hypothetical protein